MNKVLNILLTIILTITIFVICVSMTILNNRFVKLELTIHNYYEVIKNNIDKQVEVDHSVDIKDIKNDVNNYINGYYEDRTYESKIYTENNIDLSSVYNENIRFIKPMNNIKLYHDLFDIATILFITLTGYVFVKTKGKHNLNLILILSGIIGIIVAGVIYTLNGYSNFMQILVNDLYYVYLGINIFVILFVVFKKVFKSIKLNVK